MLRATRLALVAVAVVALAACSGTRALYQQPETATQWAKAVLLHHNAVGQEVARLVADPEVSASSKTTMRTAYRATVCSENELRGDTPTAECDEGPAYSADAAIRAWEAARTASTEQDVIDAANRLVPLLTVVINAVSNR